MYILHIICTCILFTMKVWFVKNPLNSQSAVKTVSSLGTTVTALTTKGLYSLACLHRTMQARSYSDYSVVPGVTLPELATCSSTMFKPVLLYLNYVCLYWCWHRGSCLWVQWGWTPKVMGPLELELQNCQSPDMGAGNWTRILRKSSIAPNHSTHSNNEVIYIFLSLLQFTFL